MQVIKSETILLVEDDDAVRDLTDLFLKEGGYRVLTARHAFEALEVAAAHREAIDLLLTDIVMPGMSGFELARQVCKDHPESRVLYLSGYTQPPEGLGSDHFLEKPFTSKILLEKVEEVLLDPSTG